MLFHFIDRLAVGLFVVVFPLFLDSLGATDPAARGRYLSLFLIPFALLQLVTGRLADRTGPFKPLFIGSVVYGVLLCIVGYADLLLLWPVMIALGLSAAVMFPPAILLTARLSNPLTRGSAMGGFNLAGSLGFAVGPILGGWVYLVWGFGAAFVMCGILEIALGLAGPFLVRGWSENIE
jgi:MFS family permease